MSICVLLKIFLNCEVGCIIQICSVSNAAYYSGTGDSHRICYKSPSMLINLPILETKKAPGWALF
jgi:hypothetical protein